MWSLLLVCKVTLSKNPFWNHPVSRELSKCFAQLWLRFEFGLVFIEVMSAWKKTQCCLFAVSLTSLVRLGAQVGVCFAVMLFFVCGLHRHGVHGLRAQCEELQEFQCGNPLDGLCDDTVGGLGWMVGLRSRMAVSRMTNYFRLWEIWLFWLVGMVHAGW